MKIGVMDKTKNKVIHSYYALAIKSLAEYQSDNYVSFEMSSLVGDNWHYEGAWQYIDGAVVYDETFTPYDPTQEQLKIYRYIPEAKAKGYDLREPPVDHNYVTGLNTKLYPKRTFNKGELILVEWYADSDFTDCILKAEMVYTRDVQGFATERTTTRSWMKEDETYHVNTKVTVKIYSVEYMSQIEEGIRRRGNIVKGIQFPVLGFMLETIAANEGETEPERQNRVLLEGRTFLVSNDADFQNFVNYSHKDILTTLSNSTDYWIDNEVPSIGNITIRAYVMNEFDIEEPV